MALFNINQPVTTQSAKRRNYQGSKLNTFALGLKGSRADGSESIFGKVISNGLPVAAGLVSAYFGLGYGTGSKVGNLAVKGLDKLAANQLEGTDSAIVNEGVEAKGDRTRQTIDTIGNIAGGIYSAAGGPTYGSGKSAEQKLFDESMKGVSDSSISEYLQNNDSDFNISSTLSGLSSLADLKGSNSNVNFDASRLDPNSALSRFYSNPQQGFNLGSGLNNFSSANMNAGQNLNLLGRTSSSLGELGGGYRALDDRKRNTGDLSSFFGYSSLNGFAEGGNTKDILDGLDYKIYDKEDKISEDLFMVDKETAKEHGLDEILSRISTGQMRYGETIFDQESTLIQENILNSNRSEREKKILLGDHIYSELLTHQQADSFADGGVVSNALADLTNPVKSFHAKYIVSPKYKERLNKQGYANPQSTINYRKSRLNDTITMPLKGMGSFYQEAGVYLNPNDEKKLKTPLDLIEAHEYSHAALQDDTLSNSDVNLLNSLNRLNSLDLNKVKSANERAEIVHDIDPYETKADIDALRYRLKKDNIYDTGTQDFNADFLNKVKTKYKGEFFLDRVLKRFGDQDLIKIMNTVASNQDPQMQRFATGGKTKPKPKSKVSKYFSTGANTADITNAKNIYNQWAQTKGLPRLSSSSSFTDDDAIAFANFNADRTNLRKLQVDSTPYLDGATNSTRALVSKIGLGEFMPELKVEPLESIAGYNKKGQAVYSDQVAPTILDKASNKLLVANNDYFPTAVDATQPTKPVSSTQINGREARATAFRNNNLVSNLSSLATIGVGGLLASQQQPRYTPTAEYTQMRDDIYARQNQGLSAAENAQLSQNLSSNYANGINSIRQIGGGGATQGAVLGALQGLSSNVDKGLLSNSILNINAQRQNQDNYQRTVLQDLNLDRQQFAADAANSANIRDNGLAMLRQGTQELYDQSLFNQSYGPNSLYTDLQESQLAGRDKYNTLASLQTELALENLRKQAGQTIVPRINNAPVNRLPAITVPNFNI